MATWTASTRLRCAADAVRTFAFTLMYMPMIPEAIEHAAPTRNATPVRIPRSIPKYSVSAKSFVSTVVMIAPRMTAANRARIAIVRYWRLMNATAPSKIVLETSCIACGPWSRRRTSRARYSAKRIAASPAGRMMSWSVLASMPVGRPPHVWTGRRPLAERGRCRRSARRACRDDPLAPARAAESVSTAGAPGQTGAHGPGRHDRRRGGTAPDPRDGARAGRGRPRRCRRGRPPILPVL